MQHQASSEMACFGFVAGAELWRGAVDWGILVSLNEGCQMGRPADSEEVRREKRRIKFAKWRAANTERAREINRESMKRAAAQKALAEGREPGKIGRPRQFTEAEKRAKQNARVKRYYHEKPEKIRASAAERERQKRAAKKAGTYELKPMRKLSAEERRLQNVALGMNRRARVRNAPGTHTAADIAFLMGAQKGKCAFCLLPFGSEKPHVDHYEPLALGGSNDRGNLRLLHPACNLKKHALPPADFAMSHGLLCF